MQNNSILIAKKAKQALKRIKGKDDYLPLEFIHFLNGFPAFISQNGLLQALAFVSVKHPKLYKEMEVFFEEKRDKNLINTLINSGDITIYIMYQKRAVSYSIWLKRLANALYKKEENGEGKKINHEEQV